MLKESSVEETSTSHNQNKKLTSTSESVEYPGSKKKCKKYNEVI